MTSFSCPPLRRPLLAFCCAAILSACQGDPGYAGRASSEWIGQLRDGDARERENAAVALGHVLAINPRLEPPITALVSALSDTSDAVRVAASRALSQPDVKAIDALAGLERLVDDSAHAAVRAQGIRALGRLLAASVAAERSRILSVLIPAHRDPDSEVRAAVADALGGAQYAASPDTDVQRALSALVTDAEPATRLRAVDALDVLSADARREALRIAMGDSSAAVRTLAVTLLARDTIAMSALQSEILGALIDSSAGVRLAAVHALGAVPVSANPRMVSALRARLADTDSAVRTEAAHALTQFHVRGGRDAALEPSLLERCRQLPPRTRGC